MFNGVKNHFLVAVMAVCLAAAFSFQGSFSASAEDGSAVVRINDTGYASLKLAVDSSKDGDTITVLEDIDTDEAITVNTNITIDLDGNMISTALGDDNTTFITSKADVAIKSGQLVSDDEMGRAIKVASGELKLDDVSVFDFTAPGNGGAVHCSEARLSVTNCLFDNNSAGNRGGAIFGESCSINIEKCEFTSNTANGLSAMNSGGGAVYYCNSPDDGKMLMTGSLFEGNEAVAYGGAFMLDTRSESEITGNTFKSNSANLSGGAGYLRIPEKALIKNNLIDGNNAIYKTHQWEAVSYYKDADGDGIPEEGNDRVPNYNKGYGGGLSVLSYKSSYTSSDIFLEDNTISNNTASKMGGGLYLYDPANSQRDSGIHLLSGIIEGNKAAWGGGIDYTNHKQNPLHLNNVLVTGNSAVRGGGIWICPQGRLDMHSTLGGVVTGNHASGSMPSNNYDGELQGHGNDIAHEGSDSQDIAPRKDGKNDSVSLSERTPGGILIDWYQDEAFNDEEGNVIHNRYGENHMVRLHDIEEYPDVFNKTDLSFGAHALIEQAGIDSANKTAALIIRNNTAEKRGGGIASNSPITFGEDRDKRITVKKMWSNEKEKLSSVKIELIRIDGSEKDVVQTVEISEKDNWTYTFEDLPSNYDYEVKEILPDGWTCQSKREETEEGAVITLTNSKIPEEPKDEPPAPEEPKDDEPKKEEPQTPDEPVSEDVTEKEHPDNPAKPNTQGTAKADSGEKTHTDTKIKANNPATTDTPLSDYGTSRTSDDSNIGFAGLLILLSAPILLLAIMRRGMKGKS